MRKGLLRLDKSPRATHVASDVGPFGRIGFGCMLQTPFQPVTSGVIAHEPHQVPRTHQSPEHCSDCWLTPCRKRWLRILWGEARQRQVATRALAEQERQIRRAETIVHQSLSFIVQTPAQLRRLLRRRWLCAKHPDAGLFLFDAQFDGTEQCVLLFGSEARAIAMLQLLAHAGNGRQVFRQIARTKEIPDLGAAVLQVLKQSVGALRLQPSSPRRRAVRAGDGE